MTYKIEECGICREKLPRYDLRYNDSLDCLNCEECWNSYFGDETKPRNFSTAEDDL